MFLTLDMFLEHFPIIKMSKDEFTRKFTVMYSKPQSLYEIFNLEPCNQHGRKHRTIIKDTSKDKRYLRRQEVIDYFYEIVITNRHKYLSLFYRAYFEFKNPLTLDWKTSDNKKILSYPQAFDGVGVISSQKNDASRRIVRNLFYLELLDLTKVINTVKSHVSFWESLTNMYNKLQLEDRFFAPSSIDLFLREKRGKSDGDINYNNLYYLFQAYQPKASIFNPYTIKWVLDKLLVPAINTDTAKNQLKIFTPVLSWSSYLIAYMQSDNFTEYVGVDVMPSVCQKCEFLSDWYVNLDQQFKGKKTSIYCQPSETLIDHPHFQQEYFDCVLVCPPYYNMEIYHEGEQSVKNYPDYQTWLEQYWGKTVELCCRVVKPGGVFAFIGNDYHTLNGEHYSLTSDLQGICERCFTLVDMKYLQNRTSPLRVNAKDRTERLYIYKK